MVHFHAGPHAARTRRGRSGTSIDVDALSFLLLQSLIGARTVSAALGRTDQLIEQIESMWSILLPALVPADKLGYFRQFVSRRLRVS